MKTSGALLVGFGVGAGIALLFAPRSGKEVQDRIRRAARNTLEDVANAGQEVAAILKEAIAEKKVPKFGEVVEAAREGYEGTKAWQEATDDVQPLAS